MPFPLISIVIPTYQHAKYLKDCIESMLGQDYPNFEVIVVDDGSTDETPAVLEQFAGRIQVIRQENRGLPAARNTGIRAAKGEWIAFQDADDVWLPGKLASQAGFLKDGQIGLVFGDACFWDGKKTAPVTCFQLYPPATGRVFDRLFVQNFILANTVMVRKTVFDQVGLFDETLTSCEDYDLWLRIARDWRIACSGEPLVYYRMHPGQMIRSREKMLLNLVRVKERHYQAGKELLTGLTQRELDRGLYNLYLKLAKAYIQQGQSQLACPWLQKYAAARGKTPLYIAFSLATRLPSSLVRPLLALVDRLHYRQDVGQG